MHFKTHSSLWIMLVLAGIAGLPCNAAVLTPSDDVTTRSNSTNYDEYNLGNGAYAGLLVKTGGSNGWIEFTLGSESVSSAVLRVYNYWTQNGVNYDLRLRAAQYGFNETALTGANAPDTSGWTTVLDSFHVNATAQWYTLDTTSFYNAHLGQTVTFKLEAVSGTGDGPIFADREGTGGHAQYPYLETTAGGGQAPVIAEVSPDPGTITANTGYVRQLVLTQGTAPVTWSVLDGPTGLAVSATGNVSGWTPALTDIGQTYGIEVQAENTYGSDTESWQVQVTQPGPASLTPNDDVTTRSDSTNYDEHDFGNGAYAGLSGVKWGSAHPRGSVRQLLGNVQAIGVPWECRDLLA